MTTHYLNPGERRYYWWPFWDLPTSNTVPSIQIGKGGPWVPMVLDSEFTPTDPPERAGAKWFRAFLAHPTAPHADAISVPVGTSRIRHRVIGNPEIETPREPDNIEYVTAL